MDPHARVVELYPIVHVDERIGWRRREAWVEEALDLAGTWGGLYVVDRYAHRNNRPSIDAYQEVARATSLWLDLGPLDAEDVMDTVIAGADRVTVRWDRIWSADEVEEVVRMVEEGVFVGLPFDDDLAPNRRSGAPQPDKLAARLAEADTGGLVLIDVGRAGTEEGFRASRFHPDRWEAPVWAAGGVSGPREARKLLSRGFAGVLVGSALDAFDPLEWGDVE